jgi:hypothetical protein
MTVYLPPEQYEKVKAVAEAHRDAFIGSAPATQGDAKLTLAEARLAAGPELCTLFDAGYGFQRECDPT